MQVQLMLDYVISKLMFAAEPRLEYRFSAWAHDFSTYKKWKRYRNT